MKKLYTNYGSYAASCIKDLQNNTCNIGNCKNCQYCISNTITLEGEFLPDVINICGMKYTATEQ